MRRRDALKTLVVAAASAGVPSTLNAMDSTTLDKYGGWTGKKFGATGFFRIEKDQRWWIVTPDGNAFLSFGINHFHPGWWRAEFNRDAWQQRLGIENINDNSQFRPALRKWFLQTCRDFGINTVGVHNDLAILNTPVPAMPYMQPFRVVDIPHWKADIPDENFVDVFSQDFAAHCNRMAAEIAAPVRDDPFLLGYSMNDCPLFTEEDLRERPDVIGGERRGARIGWPRRLRNLGPEAPGKQGYVQTVKDLYRGSIKEFNETYTTEFDSFDALASAVDWRPETDLSNANETRDNVAFLQTVVEHYYQCATDALRRHDPNHLFVGDKLHANTDSLDTVLSTTNKFTDIIFYQMYAKYEVQKPGLDRWSTMVDKPIINGDSAFTLVTETMPRPFGPVADDTQQRIEWTVEFFHKAFARPEFVGWHYCGLIDADNRNAQKTNRQHSGLVDGLGVPYTELQQAIKQCSDDLYAIATHRI